MLLDACSGVMLISGRAADDVVLGAQACLSGSGGLQLNWSQFGLWAEPAGRNFGHLAQRFLAAWGCNFGRLWNQKADPFRGRNLAPKLGPFSGPCIVFL